MNHEIISANRQKLSAIEQHNPVQRKQNNLENSAGIYNRLDTLENLARSIVNEVNVLKNSPKLSDELIDKIRKEKFSLPDLVQKYEKELIRFALAETKGNQRRAAKLLKVNVTTFNNKIKRYGIVIRNLEFGYELE